MRRLSVLAILLGVGLLTAATVSIFTVNEGGTGIRTAALNTALMGGGGSAPFVPTAMPDCQGGGKALTYNSTTHAFGCDTALATVTTTSTTTTTL